MKIRLLLFFFLPFLTFGQEPFTFPEDFEVDPNSYLVRMMNFKRIEQIHTYYFKKKEDSMRIDSNVVFDYIVEFDSNRCISSFKYDFQKEYKRTVMAGINGQVELYMLNDTSRLERMIRGLDTTYFNFYKNVFVYDKDRQLEQIKILRPDREGILDGVFIGYKSDRLTQIETHENNLLMKREVFLNDVLHCTETYKYTSLSVGESTFPFLQRISREYSNRKETIQINYFP